MYVCLWVCLSVLLSRSPPSSFEAGFLTEPRTRLEATKPWHSPHLCPPWLWDYRDPLTLGFLHACWDSNPDPHVYTVCTLTH